MNINIVKITSYIIVLLPWLSNYELIIPVPGLSLGDALLVGVFLLNIFKENNLKLTNFKRPQSFLLLFYVYALIVVFFILLGNNFYDTSLVVRRTSKMGMYFIIIYSLIPNKTNFNYFYKAYKGIVYFASFAMIIQYVGYYLFGVYLNFKIPFLNYSGDFIEGLDYTAIRLSNFRPDSIFVEPAHFVFFMIGYVAICLFWEKLDKPKIIEASIVSLIILMSISSSSILLLTVVWGYFGILILMKKDFSITKKIGIILFVIILLLIVVYIYANSSLSNSFYRLFDVQSLEDSSNPWRKIFIGSEHLKDLDILEIIFGKGLGNYRTSVFTTSIYFILYSTGLIGSLIILLWLSSNFIMGNSLGKVMIILTVMVFSTWYLIYSAFFVFYNMLIVNDKYD